MTIKNLKTLMQTFAEMLDAKYGTMDSKSEKVLSCMVKLTEEVGELSEQVMLRKGRQADYKGSFDPESAGKEVADVIISTMMLAYELDIDVQDALEKKIVTIKEKLK